MSKSSRTSRSSILLFVFVVSVALIGADLVIVSAQNTNSSGDQTRGGQMTSNDNMSGGNMNTGRSSGRRRRRGGNASNSNASTVSGGDASGTMNATMQGNANMGDQTGNMMNTNTSTGGRRRRRGGNANMSGDMSGNANMGGNTSTTGDMTGNMGGRRRRRRGGGGAVTGMTTTTTPVADSVQTDLSGTYMGTLSCAGLGGGGEGTLTITGNQYTFGPSGGGPAISGRVVAVTTRGYTAVAMQYGESVAPAPGQTATPPVIVSLRARKNGDNLMLTSIANGMKDCGFTSGSGMRSTGRRRRRGGM